MKEIRFKSDILNIDVCEFIKNGKAYFKLPNGIVLSGYLYYNIELYKEIYPEFPANTLIDKFPLHLKLLRTDPDNKGSTDDELIERVMDVQLDIFRGKRFQKLLEKRNKKIRDKFEEKGWDHLIDICEILEKSRKDVNERQAALEEKEQGILKGHTETEYHRIEQAGTLYRIEVVPYAVRSYPYTVFREIDSAYWVAGFWSPWELVKYFTMGDKREVKDHILLPNGHPDGAPLPYQPVLLEDYSLAYTDDLGCVYIYPEEEATKYGRKDLEYAFLNNVSENEDKASKDFEEIFGMDYGTALREDNKVPPRAIYHSWEDFVLFYLPSLDDMVFNAIINVFYATTGVRPPRENDLPRWAIPGYLCWWYEHITPELSYDDLPTESFDMLKIKYKKNSKGEWRKLLEEVMEPISVKYTGEKMKEIFGENWKEWRKIERALEVKK